MYVPSYFEETRIDALHGLIRAHSFGVLVTLDGGGLNANHIPFEIDSDPAPLGTLRAHVARANPVWREFSSEVGALAIFQGARAYITPAWYRTKQETGKVVPTYNYAVVHAYGVPRIVQDREWLRGLVSRLTQRHEAGRADPWKVTDAPADYVEQMLGAIVGIELRITRLVGKWKVSQNRPVADRESVVRGLRETNDPGRLAMAELVKGSERS